MRSNHQNRTHNQTAGGTQRPTLTLLAIAGLSLAGCQGTIHDRWAQRTDTVAAWSPRLSSMPIEVHGTVFGKLEKKTVASIPNGTSAGSLGATPRIVLYVGGETLPVNTTYCDVTPTLRTVSISAGKVMMGAALCDGPRLVVTARQEFSLSAVSEPAMSASIDELKSRLKFALSMGRNQIPTEGAG